MLNFSKPTNMDADFVDLKATLYSFKRQQDLFEKQESEAYHNLNRIPAPHTESRDDESPPKFPKLLPLLRSHKPGSRATVAPVSLETTLEPRFSATVTRLPAHVQCCRRSHIQHRRSKYSHTLPSRDLSAPRRVLPAHLSHTPANLSPGTPMDVQESDEERERWRSLPSYPSHPLSASWAGPSPAHDFARFRDTHRLHHLTGEGTSRFLLQLASSTQSLRATHRPRVIQYRELVPVGVMCHAPRRSPPHVVPHVEAGSPEQIVPESHWEVVERHTQVVKPRTKLPGYSRYDITHGKYGLQEEPVVLPKPQPKPKPVRLKPPKPVEPPPEERSCPPSRWEANGCSPSPVRVESPVLVEPPEPLPASPPQLRRSFRPSARAVAVAVVATTPARMASIFRRQSDVVADSSMPAGGSKPRKALNSKQQQSSIERAVVPGITAEFKKLQSQYSELAGHK